MRYSYSLAGSHGIKRKFKISATDVVLGQPVLWITGGTGTVADPSGVTDLTNAMGVTTEAGTASTTQGVGASSADVQVEVTFEPLAVFRSKVVPSATADTNYAIGDGYLLTTDSASAGGVAVIDALVASSTADMADGLVFALDGANVGQSRVIVTHTAQTQLLNTIPFDLGIVADEHFLASQYAPGVIAVNMTTDFTQADGTVAGATGGEAVVVGVYASTTAEGYSVTTPRLEIDLILQDHAFNSVA